MGSSELAPGFFHFSKTPVFLFLGFNTVILIKFLTLNTVTIDVQYFFKLFTHCKKMNS